MAKKAKKSLAKATRKAIEIKLEEHLLMPKREGLKYTANMDNIIFEATFKKETAKDALGKYVAPHLRTVDTHIVTSVGPIVNNPAMKKGARIIPVGPGKITVLEVDEDGFVGSIKPHDILAVIK